MSDKKKKKLKIKIKNVHERQTMMAKRRCDIFEWHISRGYKQSVCTFAPHNPWRDFLLNFKIDALQQPWAFNYSRLYTTCTYYIIIIITHTFISSVGRIDYNFFFQNNINSLV